MRSESSHGSLNIDSKTVATSDSPWIFFANSPAVAHDNSILEFLSSSRGLHDAKLNLAVEDETKRILLQFRILKLNLPDRSHVEIRTIHLPVDDSILWSDSIFQSLKRFNILTWIRGTYNKVSVGKLQHCGAPDYKQLKLGCALAWFWLINFRVSYLWHCETREWAHTPTIIHWIEKIVLGRGSFFQFFSASFSCEIYMVQVSKNE